MVNDTYLADLHPPVCGLSAGEHFERLTSQENFYAHHLSRAAFHGTRIILWQTSPESEDIFDLVLSLYRKCDGDFGSLGRQQNVSSDDIGLFLDYAAMVLDNMGNYKSFGDSKFIPRISTEAFQRFTSCDQSISEAFQNLEPHIYSRNSAALGHPEDGLTSTYYPDSPGISRTDINGVQTWMNSKGITSENTRLRKIQEENGTSYEILVASAYQSTLNNEVVKIVYGDHSQGMTKIVASLSAARDYASNSNQEHILTQYMESFTIGSVGAHKESQKWWIKDKSPIVEMNMGFVGTYSDPHGVRAEWDGLVAIVNKDESRKYFLLVEMSEELLVKLPWNGITAGCEENRKSAFEKPEFMKPDFTSLEILSYSTSQIWAGINIPNYDDIRQTLGYKNVSLGNRISATASGQPMPCIPSDEVEDYRRRRPPAFQIAVAIHELLGHGSGLLRSETSPGTYNFDISNPPVSPLDGKPISSWCKVGQTFGGVFGAIAQCLEEYRAECVGMFLASDLSILRLFGCSEEPGDQGFEESTIYPFKTA